MSRGHVGLLEHWYIKPFLHPGDVRSVVERSRSHGRWAQLSSRGRPPLALDRPCALSRPAPVTGFAADYANSDREAGNPAPPEAE